MKTPGKRIMWKGSKCRNTGLVWNGKSSRWQQEETPGKRIMWKGSKCTNFGLVWNDKAPSGRPRPQGDFLPNIRQSHSSNPVILMNLKFYFKKLKISRSFHQGFSPRQIFPGISMRHPLEDHVLRDISFPTFDSPIARILSVILMHP